MIKPWPTVLVDKKRFHNLYLNPQKNSVQRPILEQLRSRTLQLCPACGEDGTPNTLDHYLPKDLYPEYSVTAANLFPMCDVCQREKGTKTVNTADERLFLHPYFDQFIGAQVVALEILGPFDAPKTILIKPHPNLDVVQAALIARHLGELNIVKRYHHFFKDEYIRLLKLVNSTRQKGQDVQMNLEMFRDHALNKSVNSWGHVFYTGVLENAALMAYLKTAQLPLFL